MNVIKNELNNVKRNTENLPKIMRSDKFKRDQIRIQKKYAEEEYKSMLETHKEEIHRIKVAREVNEKKNVICEIAVNKKNELQEE